MGDVLRLIPRDGPHKRTPAPSHETGQLLLYTGVWREHYASEPPAPQPAPRKKVAAPGKRAKKRA
ncbi:MAG: hypothetical protein IPL88_15525 [Rhizobiales bacterium]|nr:hypothetical protein [Hyphomicrobiales bacterium]